MIEISTPQRRGLCLVLVGPSGSGKTSIMHGVGSMDPWLRQSVSATTRAPRPGERPGIDYEFLPQTAFDGLLASGGLLEHTSIHGNDYGTPREPVEVALMHGLDVAMVLDAYGARAVRDALLSDVVSVFIEPPSIGELERRLVARGDKAESITTRMTVVHEEIERRYECDHVVLNEKLITAVEAVRRILRQVRTARIIRTTEPISM